MFETVKKEKIQITTYINTKYKDSINQVLKGEDIKMTEFINNAVSYYLRNGFEYQYCECCDCIVTDKNFGCDYEGVIQCKSCLKESQKKYEQGLL